MPHQRAILTCESGF